jgi:hypothetical protein
MKISKLSEHIGHGTHMFHVSVADEVINECVGTLWLVAANSEGQAIDTAVRAALSLPQGESLPQSWLENARAYEIGEVEP